MTATVGAGVAAVALALVHLLGGRLRLPGVPRSAVLSAASGVSVAYVFVHLLPEVAHIGEQLDAQGLRRTIEPLEWVLALAGLLVFHGLELRVRRLRRSEDREVTDRDGWLHLAVYALYGGLIGYLLKEQAEAEETSLLLFAIAMALHFLVNDHGLREDHGELYEDRGRYLLAVAVMAGYLLDLVVHLSEVVIGLPLAFLAGSIVLTVLKEELPEGRRSRFVPFAAGAVLYSGLLLAV